jgi:lysophospholipase L1-like esterase
LKSALIIKVLKKLRRHRGIIWLLTILLTLLAADRTLHWILGSFSFNDSTKDIAQMVKEGGPPYYVLVPNTTHQMRGLLKKLAPTVSRINALGFRDRERSAEKAPGTFMIVCIGDSSTYGEGVNLEGTYPYQLEEVFHREGYQNVEVWNAGVGGYAMYDYPPYLEKRILPLKPDFVLLQLSANDAIKLLDLPHYPLWTTRYSGLAMLFFLIRFNAITDHDRYENNLMRFLEICREAHLPAAIYPADFTNMQLKRVHKALSVAGGMFFDLTDLSLTHLRGDPHYDEPSNGLIAERLFTDIEKDWICQARPLSLETIAQSRCK